MVISSATRGPVSATATGLWWNSLATPATASPATTSTSLASMGSGSPPTRSTASSQVSTDHLAHAALGGHRPCAPSSARVRDTVQRLLSVCARPWGGGTAASVCPQPVPPGGRDLSRSLLYNPNPAVLSCVRTCVTTQRMASQGTPGLSDERPGPLQTLVLLGT